ncbi:FAD dependent oxidoreductase, partial [Cutaneotrichosporon oleaginosum]
MSKFPQPWRSTVSHWQATNRGPTSLYGHGADDELPEDADILIVGAGMMGCALSYFLTRLGGAGAGKRVVCVESKDVASGASGRNGGHVGPKTYALWHQLQQAYPLGAGLSAEEAVRVMQNERDNLDLVERVVADEGLQVDFWRGELLETHHDKARTKWCKEQYEAWLSQRKKMGLSGDETKFIDDAAEAEKLSRFKGVTSVHVRPGGSVHPHKLATALMHLALASPHAQFSLHSWTPASGHPQRRGDRWVLQTSKGAIRAPRVILCTNAHTRHFFPRSSPLHGHIEPYVGQCSSLTPTPTFSGAGALRNTYNMLDGHYLVRTASGELVLGGGVAPLVRSGATPMSRIHGNVDDSEASIDPAITRDHATFMRNFEAWGPEAYGEGLVRTWVGVLSAVRDWLPLVGDVPGSAGLSVAAGFAGHGMARIFAVARGYADTLKKGRWDTALLPRCFEITEERLRRAEAA